MLPVWILLVYIVLVLYVKVLMQKHAIRALLLHHDAAGSNMAALKSIYSAYEEEFGNFQIRHCNSKPQKSAAIDRGTCTRSHALGSSSSPDPMSIVVFSAIGIYGDEKSQGGLRI